MYYFDCHTYIAPTQNDVIAIVNSKWDAVFGYDANVSIGLHPYTTAKNLSLEEWDYFTQQSENASVVAIGECGLDDRKRETMDMQKSIFGKQIAIAEKCNKPLIIHCVKAFSTLFQMLSKVNVPTILHGVNNKFSTLKMLVECGMYMSFGEALLRENSIARRMIHHVPPHLLLLESDEGNYSIEEIYKVAAEVLAVDTENLSLQIEQNFKRIFPV